VIGLCPRNFFYPRAHGTGKGRAYLFHFQINTDFVAFALPCSRTVCGSASRHYRFGNGIRYIDAHPRYQAVRPATRGAGCLAVASGRAAGQRFGAKADAGLRACGLRQIVFARRMGRRLQSTLPVALAGSRRAGSPAVPRLSGRRCADRGCQRRCQRMGATADHAAAFGPFCFDRAAQRSR